MKVKYIGDNQNFDCYILKINDLKILIDYSLKIVAEDTIIFKHVKLNDVNINDIDIILISNSYNMIGLPFLTKSTEFKGKIYATEPTVEIAKILIEDLISGLELRNHLIYEKKPSVLFNKDTNKIDLKNMYTQSQANECFSKVSLIGILQNIMIDGGIMIYATCSGYSIGSCNWVIETNSHKIVYLSNSSLLSTHSSPMDIQNIANCDVLVASNYISDNSATADSVLNEITRHISSTLKDNGNVLFPIYPSGFIYDLIECITLYIDHVGLSTIPIYLVGSTMESSLSYADICSEWLCQSKQTRVFSSDSPFIHNELKKNNRIKCFSSIDEMARSTYKKPFIMFASHPSLLIGDSASIINIWFSNYNHSCILTCNDYHLSNFRSFSDGFNMKFFECYLNVNLDVSQLNKIIKDCKPSYVITNDAKMNISDKLYGTITFVKSNQYTTINLGLPINEQICAELECNLDDLKLSEYNNSLISPLSCVLSSSTSKYPFNIKQFEPMFNASIKLSNEEIVKELDKMDITNVFIESTTRNSSKINIESLKTTINTIDNETKISFDSSVSESTILKLLDIFSLKKT